MCIVGLLTLLSLLFYVPYQTINIQIDNITQENRQEADDDKNLPLSGRINPDDYSNKRVYKALRTWKLWRLFLIYSLTNFVISMISTTYRAISIAKGRSTRITQAIGTGSFIIGCIFNPLWGLFYDKVRY